MRGGRSVLVGLVALGLLSSGCLTDDVDPDPGEVVGGEPQRSCGVAAVLDETYTSASTGPTEERASFTLPDGLQRTWFNITVANAAGSYTVEIKDEEGETVSVTRYTGVEGAPVINAQVDSSGTPKWDVEPSPGTYNARITTQGVTMDLRVTIDASSCQETVS